MARKSVHDFEYQLVALRLRRVRERAGYTQVAAAKALGRNQSYVSKVEIGERRLDIVEVQGFLELYGVSITNILSPKLNTEERALKAELDSRLYRRAPRRGR